MKTLWSKILSHLKAQYTDVTNYYHLTFFRRVRKILMITNNLRNLYHLFKIFFGFTKLNLHLI